MKAIPLVFIAFLFCSCSTLQDHHPESGYSSTQGKTKSGWRKVGVTNNSESLIEQKESISSDTRLKLKQLENSLTTKKELEQYSKSLPYFTSEEEKIQFLELGGFESRQKWIKEKSFIQRQQKNQAAFKELIEAQDIALGMPESMVRQSWGEPDTVEVSGNPQFRNFRWKYNRMVSTSDGYKSERKVVYFEGGKVIGWEIE
ncbi:MAG: hypothetical protein BroJett040_19840 [Oligoflexia bacterium]|nr:MAG: hypothetical protein BroJett040_19840 [Oligoflexia bacterium]